MTATVSQRTERQSLTQAVAMDPLAEFRRHELRPVGCPFIGGYEEPWLHRGQRFLNHDSTLLGIGSCFSVNLLRWLALHGLDVVPAHWGMHYNPATILRELECIVGEAVPDITWEANCHNGQVRYIDAVRHPVGAPARDDLAAMRRRIYEAGAAGFVRSNAFFVLLGLAEIWEELDADGNWHIINRSPPASVCDPHRHRNRNLDVREVRNYLHRIVDLIRSKRGVVPIILAVDPIALKSSSNGQDVRVANVRSKAALLAGLFEYLDQADEHTFYFPAYELLNGGPRPQELWQRDGRHPNAPAITIASREFVRAFAIQPEKFEQELPFEVIQV
jgi:hypothetical protein